MVEEIKALKELLDMGAITQDDFDRKKQEILSNPSQPDPAPFERPSVSFGVQQRLAQPQQSPRSKSKMVAALLAIFLGGIGAHKFYLNYSKQGLIMLAIWACGWISFLLTLITFFFPLMQIGCLRLMGSLIVPLIEGIIYLAKSDEAFESTYVLGYRPWF